MTTEYTIYERGYTDIGENPFDTIDDAVRYAIAELPSDDFPYLIGTHEKVDVIVFQGLVYWPKEPPAVHPVLRHDGGFWIICPFCVDDPDPLGICSACNGTRKIWEMPRE